MRLRSRFSAQRGSRTLPNVAWAFFARLCSYQGRSRWQETWQLYVCYESEFCTTFVKEHVALQPRCSLPPQRSLITAGSGKVAVSQPCFRVMGINQACYLQMSMWRGLSLSVVAFARSVLKGSKKQAIGRQIFTDSLCQSLQASSCYNFGMMYAIRAVRRWSLPQPLQPKIEAR